MSTDDGDRHDSEFAGTLLGGPVNEDNRDVTVVRPRRADRHQPTGRGRKRRTFLIPLIAGIIVVILAVGGFIFVRNLADGLGAKDYSGEGTGSVVVQIKTGDGSGDIGTTLKDKGVVASRDAFVNAARDSGRSEDFEAGFFKLHLKMSAKAAVVLLLDSSSRVSTKVTLAEGLIVPQVLSTLSKSPSSPLADLQAAAKDIDNLGLPDGFTAAYAEGFLYPATYNFDPGVDASEALQTLTAQFDTEIHKLNFVADAKKLHITAYQALIIASLVEAETKFDEDRAKVARVVFNRLASGMNLGFDTTTAYEYRLQGKDPTKATYKETSPYNTRLNPGLPPTPIDNPGEKSLTAAVEPAAGNWLYFVSKDAAGHLFFTNDPAAFDEASQKCIDNHWGCT